MYTLKNFYHLLIRLLVAAVASHFVVVHNTEKTWLELFTKRYYYSSLLYSMIIAFLLIEYVYFITKRLNITFEDDKHISKRIAVQFLLGFCSTAFFAFLMALVLFWLNGENIFNSNYFEKLYIFILLFIFTVNVVYLLYFQYTKAPKRLYQAIKLNNPQLTSLRAKALKANLPAIIYHEDKAYFTIDFNGIKTSWPHTIEQSMKILNPENYFQISRKAIVHRATISSFNAYKIKCLKIEVDTPCHIELITSRRKAAFFKEWINH